MSSVARFDFTLSMLIAMHVGVHLPAPLTPLSVRRGFPASTASRQDPLFNPKMPVVCAGFAFRMIFHTRSDRDVCKNFPLKLGGPITVGWYLGGCNTRLIHLAVEHRSEREVP
jgi:hypothetical protein